MPDTLYDQDVLAWSVQQADLLRRFARGERPNNVDWTRVAEEIEDLGLSELHAAESFLNLMLVHLLKLLAWPDSEDRRHWRGEVVAFQRNLRRRFAPSMRQRIDLDALYADALAQLRAGYPGTDWPSSCPASLDQLLADDLDALTGRFSDAARTQSA